MDPITNVIIPEIKAENDDELIMISIERLKKLELLESTLPEMIESAIQGYKKNKLKMLHEKDKLNPEAVNLRVKRYNERHKDEINARRKAKRNAGKNYGVVEQTNSVVDSLTVPKQPETTVLKSVVTSTAKEFTIRF